MRFTSPLIFGKLLRRYQRFLVDVELHDGSVVTAHCANTGSMKTCAVPGWTVGLSRSDNPRRKLPYTWELVHNGTCWIGINTHVPNRLAEEALHRGRIPELIGYPRIRRERPYGQNSRIDLLLGEGAERCYVEVKNVTLVGSDGQYCFPDAVTKRGRKHLGELETMVRQGYRAVMLYVIQRSDGRSFRPAHEIDPDYAMALRTALEKGVEMLAYRAHVTPEAIELKERVEPCPDWFSTGGRMPGDGGPKKTLRGAEAWGASRHSVAARNRSVS